MGHTLKADISCNVSPYYCTSQTGKCFYLKHTAISHFPNRTLIHMSDKSVTLWPTIIRQYEFILK